MTQDEINIAASKYFKSRLKSLRVREVSVISTFRVVVSLEPESFHEQERLVYEAARDMRMVYPEAIVDVEAAVAEDVRGLKEADIEQ